MFKNSDIEFDLTSQTLGKSIWTHGFSTETETAEKNNNVAQCIIIPVCDYYWQLQLLSLLLANSTTNTSVASMIVILVTTTTTNY